MTNENRLIDAKKLYEAAYKSYGPRANLCDECYSEIVNLIDDAPTVDAVEVVHGRWVDRWGGKYANPHYECSMCKQAALYKCDRNALDNGLWLQDLSDYCPNCGAKMDGGNEDG